MTQQDQINLLTGIAEFVRQSIAAAVESRDKRITDLEARIAALESTGIKFVGVYQRAQNYSRGDVCTLDGAMWVCIIGVGPNEVPGKSMCWQLAIKTPRPATIARTQHSQQG